MDRCAVTEDLGAYLSQQEKDDERQEYLYERASAVVDDIIEQGIHPDHDEITPLTMADELDQDGEFNQFMTHALRMYLANQWQHPFLEAVYTGLAKRIEDRIFEAHP